MRQTVPLHPGVQDRVLGEAPAASGISQVDISLETDAILVTLWVDSIAGTLDVGVFATTADSGKESLLFAFPQLSAGTTDLLLRRSSISTKRVRIRVTYSDACAYEVYARAVGSGSSDTRILGANSFETDQVTVGTTNIVLIPSVLTDRSGLVIKNWSDTQVVYLAESSAKLTAGKSYPLAPKDALAMDVSAGVEVWAVSDTAGADVRLGQSGG